MSESHPAPRNVFDDTVGWVALPGFLSGEDVVEVLDLCHELLASPPEQRRGRDRVGTGTQHLSELDDRSETIRTILDRSPLIELISEILGPEFRRSEVGYRSPGPGFGGQRLHADDPPKLDQAPATVATAIIALTDFTSLNGATRLVPGSHRRPDLQRLSGSLEEHRDQITLTGSAGTAFVFSGHLLHSGTTNRSSEPRPALHLVWRR